MSEVTPSIPQVRKGQRFRHRKRGGAYEVLGVAQVQAPESAPLTDYELAVVYRGTDGELWVRRRSEFQDGRFEAMPAADLPWQLTVGPEATLKAIDFCCWLSGYIGHGRAVKIDDDRMDYIRSKVHPLMVDLGVVRRPVEGKKGA